MRVGGPGQEEAGRQHARLALAGTALVALGAAICIWVGINTRTDRQAEPTGSFVTIAAPVKIVEPSAESILASSELADTLFAAARPRTLAHDDTYDNVLDGETLHATRAFSEVADAIGTIEDGGHDIGIVLVDLETGASFAYNAEEAFYSASSIKGPYVTCVFDELVETGETSLAEASRYAQPTIVNSDNGAYANMHRRYGGDVFEAWLEEIGYDLGEYESYDEISEHWYIHIDAWQLAALWERSYEYLTSGTEAAEQLAGYFEERTYSALGDALGERYVTWGKAGWYPSRDGSAWPATVDAGIVWAEHPYLVAVLSNIPDDMPKLVPVFEALDGLHEGLYLLGNDYRIE